MHVSSYFTSVSELYHSLESVKLTLNTSIVLKWERGGTAAFIVALIAIIYVLVRSCRGCTREQVTISKHCSPSA